MRGSSLILLSLQFVSAWAAAAASNPTAAAPRLKVLCMHGYSQNGAVLRDRSGGFRKPFKKSRFEMSYPDGLFGCTKDGEDQDEADADLKRRAWWRGHSGQETYVGWDESHAAMCELWERERFDGVIGFSQGAAAAAMLCAELNPRFGIFVAGFVPNDRAAAAALLSGVDASVPTLHVIGTADSLVTPERSMALADLFDGRTVLTHPGGHMIPSAAHVRGQVASFVEGALVECQQPEAECTVRL